MIPYGRQDINEKDIAEVVKVLQSDFLTQGPQVPRFEKAIADYCHVEHGVAVNSATSALHIACLALGLGPGDHLWTSPITYVASANCGLYCSATVDFVDIDPRTYNICPVALEAKLEEAKLKSCLPKIVVPVHLAGQSCDMQAIKELAQKYQFKIIEDASHAIGAAYKGSPVGNCRYSDICIFSFHPVKIITTAEGGLAVTNDPLLAEKLNLLRSHGITKAEQKMQYRDQGPWYYEQQDLGFNYRMTEVQAALGTSQMERLDTYVSRRQELALRYNYLLSEFPLLLPWQHPDTHSSFHLYVIRLDLSRITTTHRACFESLREQGIGVNLHYIPIPRQPYYRNLGLRAEDYPEAEKYYAEAISIPLYATMSDQQQDAVVEALDTALNR